MSQGYVPGPCQIFAGVGNAGAYVFVGYSEDGVKIRLNASYEDIVSDFGGPVKPVDAQFMGEDGYFMMTLNKYNEAVLQTILKRRVGSGVTAGAIEANGLGSLMVAQGYYFPCCLVAPYSVQSFQSATMVPGYTFSVCWLHDDFEVDISVRLKRPRLIFRAIPLWNSTALTATLYTNTIPGSLPSVN